MTPINNRPTRTLPSILRTSINRMAHQAGIEHETRTRAELIALVQQALANGATVEAAGVMIATHAHP